MRDPVDLLRHRSPLLFGVYLSQPLWESFPQVDRIRAALEATVAGAADQADAPAVVRDRVKRGALLPLQEEDTVFLARQGLVVGVHAEAVRRRYVG